MQTLEMGLVPGSLNVTLTTGADFGPVEFEYEVGGVVTSWPVGTELTLVFGNGTTWTADIVTSVATFQEESAVADLIPAGTTVEFRYTNGTTNHTYWIGTVRRRRNG